MSGDLLQSIYAFELEKDASEFIRSVIRLGLQDVRGYLIYLGVPKMRLAITNIYQNDPFKRDDQHPESRL